MIFNRNGIIIKNQFWSCLSFINYFNFIQTKSKTFTIYSFTHDSYRDYYLSAFTRLFHTIFGPSADGLGALMK